MKSNPIISAVLMPVILGFLGFGAACGKSEKGEGPAERAGATMGKAIDRAAEQANQAMGRAGEALKETSEKIEENLDKTKQERK